MFIRLKTPTSNDVNVNIKSIRSFAPQGDYSILTFNDGSTLSVTDSTRSLRGYIKKALMAIHSGGASSAPSDDQDDTDQANA